MHPPQLCGAKAATPPNSAASRQQLIDKLIRYIPREQFQKFGGSDCRQVFAHDKRATLSDATCRRETKNPQILSVTISTTRVYASFRNTLRRDRPRIAQRFSVGIKRPDLPSSEGTAEIHSHRYLCIQAGKAAWRGNERTAVRRKLPARLARGGHPSPNVAQVSNLLYRRLRVGRPFASGGVCGLEIRDTADWKSALRDARRAMPPNLRLTQTERVARPFSTRGASFSERGAGFQPAVSPTSSRQTVRKWWRLRIGNPRYGGLEICATRCPPGYAAKPSADTN